MQNATRSQRARLRLDCRRVYKCMSQGVGAPVTEPGPRGCKAECRSSFPSRNSLSSWKKKHRSSYLESLLLLKSDGELSQPGLRQWRPRMELRATSTGHASSGPDIGQRPHTPQQGLPTWAHVIFSKTQRPIPSRSRDTEPSQDLFQCDLCVKCPLYFCWRGGGGRQKTRVIGRSTEKSQLKSRVTDSPSFTSCVPSPP